VHWDGQNLKFPVVFKSDMKNKRKFRKNGNFYAKSGFEKIDFGFWCNSKTMAVGT